MTPERKVKNEVTKILKASAIYYFTPIGSGYGSSGIPDIICCVGGRFLGIECKAGKNTPTALQELEMAKIKAAGGYAVVVNEQELEWFKTWIQDIVEDATSI